MPFTRPTLPELDQRVVADITSRLPATDARARRSNLEVLARTHAGATHNLYGYLDWQSRQLLPDTADGEYLARHASIWGIGRHPASAARGIVNITGINDTVIAAGTIFKSPAGPQYQTDSSVTIASNSGTVAVTAQTPGRQGNLAAGIKLSLLSPMSGITAVVVGSDGLTGGADTEADAALRARVLARIQQPPHGGALHDYTAWALSAHPAVTRVWPSAMELGAGTVTIRIMTDETTDNGIPTKTVIDAVQSHIDNVRPVTARVTVVAPVPVPIDIALSGLTPDTPQVRAAIRAELSDLIRRTAVPGGKILISHIREAVSIAAGEHDHAVTNPTANVTHGKGKIAVMGNITYG